MKSNIEGNGLSTGSLGTILRTDKYEHKDYYTNRIIIEKWILPKVIMLKLDNFTKKRVPINIFYDEK